MSTPGSDSHIVQFIGSDRKLYVRTSYCGGEKGSEWSLFHNSGQLFLRAQTPYMVIRFSVSTLRESFEFAADSSPDFTSVLLIIQ